MLRVRLLDGKDAVPEVVEGLRDLLARAERGEIRGYAFATACDAAGTGSGMEIGDGDVAHLYTAMARLQRRLLDLQ
jgi:hypothetical protein